MRLLPRDATNTEDPMRPFAPVRLSIVATLLAASPALAGPPWISIEYPANPYDAGTRGALLTLHTYHHGVPLDGAVSARAEAMVDGVRRSIPLVVRATGRPGVYAVSGELPAGGTWVITSTMGEPGSTARASALLALDAERRVVGLTVPLRRSGQWITPREATAADVDALLGRGRGVAATSGRDDGRALPAAAAVAGLGLLACAPALRRRRRAAAAADAQV